LVDTTKFDNTHAIQVQMRTFEKRNKPAQLWEEPVTSSRGSGCPIELPGCLLPRDAGLHALRHTFLTEAGSTRIRFYLQYVAGHDNIKTTMRYVHPREEAVEKLFGAAREFGAAGGAW